MNPALPVLPAAGRLMNRELTALRFSRLQRRFGLPEGLRTLNGDIGTEGEFIESGRTRITQIPQPFFMPGASGIVQRDGQARQSSPREETDTSRQAQLVLARDAELLADCATHRP